MTDLRIGPTGTVQGRLPHNWRIVARFNYETSIVQINSPDTDRFSLEIDTSKLHEYSSIYKPAVGVLEDACLVAKYDIESGVLRYDTTDVPEFWLEVRVKEIIKVKKSSKKQKTSKHKFPNPFKDLDEETVDNCIEELYWAESLTDLEEELKGGYDCTKDQALYWLKKKYNAKTSYGEDLYRRLKSETRAK